MKGWQERYTALFGAAMLIAIVSQPIASALGSLARQADPARAGSGLALVAVAYAAYLTLARAAGPVVVSAADASWRLLSPLPRRTVLGRTTLALLAISVLSGLVLGVALISALGAPDHTSLRLTVALVLGVGAGLGGMALTVLGQASPAWDEWVQALIAFTVVAAVLLAVLGAGSGRHLITVLTGAPVDLAVAAAGCAAAVATFLVRQAWIALDRLPARAIIAASTRSGQVAQATVMVDPGALTWAAEDNHWRARTLRSRPWPVRGAWALAWQEVRRTARRPVRFAVLVSSCALPALAVAAGLTAVATVLVMAGALGAAASVTAGARRDSDNPALSRLLAVGRRAATSARALPPALLGAAWLSAALAGMSATGALSAGPWWLLGPACAPALAAAALRMAGRRPVDHSLPIIDTPGGAIPTGPLLWAMTGVDLALLGCAPTLVALAVQPADLIPYLMAQALTGLGVIGGYALTATGHKR